MLKLNRLFFSTIDANLFTHEIEPTKVQKEHLQECKNKIRDHLRPRIAEVTVRVLGMHKRIEPRFRTQGSWAYKTCVQPAQHPPQEMDWDFGVYLPVDVWRENGPPAAMAKAYFDLVESLLTGLCDEEGWELTPGKDTCIRLKVSNWAHIDIPLYAAPEEEFRKVMEKAAVLSNESRALDAVTDFSELLEQEWDDLDQIMMATRNGDWRASDPEAVANWFKDRLDEHGEQLRRVSRYLKAWRDRQWKVGGPSSVSIMIAIAQNFVPIKGRDDLVLEDSAKKLAAALARDLYEIGIDGGAEDFNRLTPSDRVDASKKARDLAGGINSARSLRPHQKTEAINNIRHHFGSRIPAREDLIESDSGADEVRSTAAIPVAAPFVTSTKAG